VITGSYEREPEASGHRALCLLRIAVAGETFMIAEGYRNSDPVPISKPKESIRDMPRIPSPADRQRRLFPMTESSVNLPAEQQRELRMAMADLLLSAFVGSSSNSTKLCNKRRSTEDESKADR
jgi:hypothetical protein